jgi:CHAT domain-containing protein
LHAAGIYHGSGQECVSDYVISSYIPTVTSLINANKASLAETLSNDDKARTHILLVAQPEVQGLPSLPHAEEEAAVVQCIIPGDSIINLDQNLVGNSIVESVLARLPETSILHLACHAIQCKDDPLQSGFDLADGRLTLRELMRVNHPKAQLAYLSACESAAVDENQPDEAINLAATMLFVGFKSVIATMWSVMYISFSGPRNLIGDTGR